jgi:PAS domain S-box-containing protein
VVLVTFVRRRKDVPFSHLFWLFGAFILGCGTTHLMEVIVTYWPLYRLAGVIKFFTAVVSLTTVAALVPVVPKALRLRSPEELEKEVEARTAELAQVNHELRLSEARERALFDHAPVGMAQVEVETGRFNRVNAAYCDLVGYSAEELLAGLTFKDLTHPEDRQTDWEGFQMLVRGEKLVNVAEKRYVRKDGQVIWVRLNASLECDQAGRPWRSIAIVENVTDRKQAVEELAEKHRLALLQVTVGEAIAAGGTLREVLQDSAAAMVQGLDAALVRVWTLNECDNVLELQASAGLYTHRDGPDARVPLGQLQIGRIAQGPEPFLTNAIAENQDFDQDWVRREGLVAFAGLPLIVAGHTVGVLAVFARHALAPPTQRTLASLAEDFAQLIDRKRLEEELAHRARALEEERTHLVIEIAERMRAEEEAKKFQRIIENSFDAYLLIDQEGRFAFANQTVFRKTGFSRKDLAKLRAWDLDPKLSPDQFTQLFAEIQQGPIPRFETLIRRRDGTTLPAEIGVIGIEAEGQRFVAVVARDLTERKKTEEELRGSQERLRIALEAAELATWEADLDTGTLVESPNSHKLFGLPPGVLKKNGEEWLSRIHPEDRERVWAAIQEAIKTCSPYQSEYRTVAPDGSIRWVAARGIAQCNESGRPVRAIGVAQDVTREKVVEEERKAHVAKLQELAHLLEQVHVLVRGLDNRITFWSKGTEELYGWSAAEALGRDSHELLRTQFPQPREEIRVELMRTGQWTGEMIHTSKDGTRVVVASHWALHRDEQGEPVAILEVNNDVTELKKVRERLEEADRQKDEFLAMLAHELRNPLAPIHNAIRLLQTLGPDQKELVWARGVVQRQVQHLSRLVDDLLDVSRINRGKITLKKEVVDLGEVIARAVETSLPLIEAKGHQLSVAMPPRKIYLVGDSVRLAQVISNLLNNAAKYTDQGGRIELLGQWDPNQVVLRVRDTGIGIPADMLPRVFDLFQQVNRSLDRSEGGLGIGLTLVRRLVELHRGTIEAHSAGPGMGSEFVVRLPIRPENVPQTPSTIRENVTRGQPAGRRVLVVDDNRDAAESLALLLRLKRHEVQVAYDGPEALEAARRHHPEVVVLDIGLPRMDGYEVARRLRQEPGLEKTTLIALTGYGRDEDRRRSQEAGFDRHLTKPVDPLELMNLLTRAPN